MTPKVKYIYKVVLNKPNYNSIRGFAITSDYLLVKFLWAVPREISGGGFRKLSNGEIIRFQNTHCITLGSEDE